MGDGSIQSGILSITPTADVVGNALVSHAADAMPLPTPATLLLWIEYVVVHLTEYLRLSQPASLPDPR